MSKDKKDKDDLLKNSFVKDDLLKAVLKRALGYTSEESVEERDSDMTVVKQKTTVKQVAPCLAAAKFLMEKMPLDPYEEMSDQELEQEKLRLLEMLGRARKMKERKKEEKGEV